jgi:hypothetical protein
MKKNYASYKYNKRNEFPFENFKLPSFRDLTNFTNHNYILRFNVNEKKYFKKNDNKNIKEKTFKETILSFMQNKQILEEDYQRSFLEYSAFQGVFNITDLFLKYNTKTSLFSYYYYSSYSSNPYSYIYLENKSQYNLFEATSKGYVNVVELLLDDPRIDPSYFDNYVFNYFHNKKINKILSKLWKNKKVRDSLKIKYPKLYRENNIKYNIQDLHEYHYE